MMKTTEIMLLVGGPCDGRRVAIDGRLKVYYAPRVNRIDMSIYPPEDEHEARFMKDICEEYVRCEDRVYAHVSVSHVDVVDILVSGYRCEIGK